MKPCVFALLFFPVLFYGKTGDQEEEAKTVPLGNFALPVSQQSSPLVSFGENIINKGQVQLFLFADAYIGKDNYYTEGVPSLLYGLKDNFSIFLNVPFSPQNKYGRSHSSGMEDVFLQLEYAFYSQGTSIYQNQAIVVGNVTFPTGSASKKPPTGWGASTYFLGGTFNHMREHWFFFTSYGGVIATANHGKGFGNQVLYEAGFGRNFPSPKGWIFAWMTEFDGIYSGHGKKIPNSGGNTIYITPSLWASSEHFLFQLGVEVPFIQNLFEHQLKDYAVIDFNCAYTF